MLNNMKFYNDESKQTLAMNDAKQLFGENTPYTIIPTIDGEQIVFNTHFTDSVRTALSTECVLSMSKYELSLFKEFIAWQSWLVDQDPIVEAGSEEDTFYSKDNDAMMALNNWLVDEVAGQSHPKINTCQGAT